MNRFASGYDDLFDADADANGGGGSGATPKRADTPKDLAEFLALAAEAIQGLEPGGDHGTPAPPADAGPRAGRRRVPAMPAPMDVLEVPEGLLVLMDLPGVTEADLEIVAARRAIRIRAARRLPLPPAARPVRRERPAGVVERLISIPPGFAGTGMEARLEAGVLAVMVPRVEPSSDAATGPEDGAATDEGGWPGPWNHG